MSAAPAEATDPVEMMVLGTYHMVNSENHLVNAKVDDVTQAKRQRELAALADALAAWKPTKILVEWEEPPPFTVAKYRAFTRAHLTKQPNEVIQIGFRLARQMGHKDVYGFDEQPSDGEPDYFPFPRVKAYADAHGQAAAVDGLLDFFKTRSAAEDAEQGKLSIAEILRRKNQPDYYRRDHAMGYYGLLAVGDANDQPGAELNAYWYMRNAKMFAKIGLISEPRDRVLVLVGAGHKFWLSHFAALTPGYKNVDPTPYLERAAASTR